MREGRNCNDESAKGFGEFVLSGVNLRGVVLPIVDLALRFGFPPTELTVRHAIIVVEFGRQVAGLLVDGVSGIFTAGENQIQPTPDIGSRCFQAAGLSGSVLA